MKKIKNIKWIIGLAVILVVFSIPFVPATTMKQVKAATIKINTKKKTLKIGKTYQLKITGTKKKVSWKSSNPAVASVSKTGKVKAKKAGKATITAKVNNKKFTCKITVSKPIRADIANAPFKAREDFFGYRIIVPESWATFYGDIGFEDDSCYSVLKLVPSWEWEGKSSVIMTFDIKEEKSTLLEKYNEKTLPKLLELQECKSAIISNYKTEEIKTKIGEAVHLTYDTTAVIDKKTCTFTTSDYFIFTKERQLTIHTVIFSDEINNKPSFNEVVEYLVKTISESK